METGKDGVQNRPEYQLAFCLSMDLVIRKMEPADIDAIPSVFASWNKFRPQYEKYFQENEAGKRVTLVATINDKVAGYANVLWTSKYPPFSDAGIPEINDLNVITVYQNRGIGRALIAAAEQVINEQGHAIVGIGVGQTADYSAAQHLYPALGYVPVATGPQPSEDGAVVYLTREL
jgi:GNAT superfamily N-acetyltransferase